MASEAPSKDVGPRANDRFQMVEREREIFLVADSPEMEISVNETAAAIWALSDGATTRDVIVMEVGRLFEQTDLEAVAEDVDYAIEELTKSGALFRR